MSQAADQTTEAGRIARPAEVAVWDPLVRIFHWSLVGLFVVTFASEDLQRVHQPAGYAILALVGLRIVWGLIGSRHARFTDFVPSPRSALAYVRSLTALRPPRSLGHNPLGGLMVLALLGMLVATGISGWLMTWDGYRDAEWVEEMHEAAASGLLALVVLHVLGVISMSILHGENLVRSMITGRKAANPGQQD